MPKTAARPECAICGAAISDEQMKWHPFCSARCKDVDLHHWLTGRYAIPTDETPEDQQTEFPDEEG